jgi:hypothetical protein
VGYAGWCYPGSLEACGKRGELGRDSNLHQNRSFSLPVSRLPEVPDNFHTWLSQSFQRHGMIYDGDGCVCERERERGYPTDMILDLTCAGFKVRNNNCGGIR